MDNWLDDGDDDQPQNRVTPNVNTAAAAGVGASAGIG